MNNASSFLPPAHYMIPSHDAVLWTRFLDMMYFNRFDGQGFASALDVYRQCSLPDAQLALSFFSDPADLDFIKTRVSELAVRQAIGAILQRHAKKHPLAQFLLGVTIDDGEHHIEAAGERGCVYSEWKGESYLDPLACNGTMRCDLPPEYTHVGKLRLRAVQQWGLPAEMSVIWYYWVMRFGLIDPREALLYCIYKAVLRRDSHREMALYWIGYLMKRDARVMACARTQFEQAMKEADEDLAEIQRIAPGTMHAVSVDILVEYMYTAEASHSRTIEKGRARVVEWINCAKQMRLHRDCRKLISKLIWKDFIDWLHHPDTTANPNDGVVICPTDKKRMRWRSS